MKTAKGSFEVKGTPHPPLGEIGHMSFEKRFFGALTGTSVVQMLNVRGQVEGSAAYVAMERIDAGRDGRKGVFFVHHVGRMDRGAASLAIALVPDSGTGELKGLNGTMTIDIVDGKHIYAVEYELGV